MNSLLKSKIGTISKIKLRITSYILFILSGIAGAITYITREEWTMCRVRLGGSVPPQCIEVHYIKELLATTVLLFITAFALFIVSFIKKKK